jgi:hypothetical protein
MDDDNFSKKLSNVDKRAKAYESIKTLSTEYNISHMGIARMLRPIPIMEDIVQLQEKLFLWDREDVLDILNKAKLNKADLDFIDDKIDPVLPGNCLNIVTPLLQLAKQETYLSLPIRTERYHKIGKIGEWFIQNGASLNTLSDKQSNALMIAIDYNNQFLAKSLIEHSIHINIDQQDYRGATALFIAIIRGILSADGPPLYRNYIYPFAIDMMKKLIQKGANPFLKASIWQGRGSLEQTPKEYVVDYCGNEYTDNTRAILNILIEAEENWNVKIQ